MEIELLHKHQEILHKLDSQKGEFFYNEYTGFAKDIFKRLRLLNRNIDQWIRMHEKGYTMHIYTYYSERNFQKEIKKTITLINQLSVDKRVYWGNREFLSELKEQLESLSLMIELTK